jgi:hypothetical protein
MTEELRSVLLGTAGLSMAAVIALLLTLARDGIDADKTRLRAAARLVVIAILFQAAHFAEELATGFHERFPELLGLTPWSHLFFVSFNLFWLAIWTLSILGLVARRQVALFPLWFLGIGSVVNGLAHPSFAALTGAYFPGLVTSPVIGVVGVLLLRHLWLITGTGKPAVAAA